MYQKIEKYAGLVNKGHEAEVAWLRQIITQPLAHLHSWRVWVSYIL